jgi:membrane protease YdiL (CAAX protease family)
VVAGILGSAVFFALAHAYQGRKGFTTTFIVGCIFSIVRAWTSSLFPTIVAHFIADFSIGMLAPAKLRWATGAGSAGRSPK